METGRPPKGGLWETSRVHGEEQITGHRDYVENTDVILASSFFRLEYLEIIRVHSKGNNDQKHNADP